MKRSELIVAEPINSTNWIEAAAAVLAAIRERVRLGAWKGPSSKVTTLVDGTNANGQDISSNLNN